MLKKIIQTISLLIVHTLVIAQPAEFTVEKLSFSSDAYFEFSPVYYGEGIVFCGNINKNPFVVYETVDGKPLFDMYFIKTINGVWDNPQIFAKALSSKFNDGPATFSGDQLTVFYTQNVEKKSGNPDVTTLGIFESHYENGQWTTPTPFEYNSPEYAIMHPALTPDGKRVYFASNMQGSRGGNDIFYSDFINNRWTTPTNMGSKINSSYNELFPYVHPSGRLFFASDRSEGLGGLDVYYTIEEDDSWKQPRALGAPLNSKYDDFGITATNDFRTGYFSSNREGTDDVFSFKSVYPFFDNCDSIKKNSYCYRFSEAGSFPTDGMPLFYEWDTGDGTRTRGLNIRHCYQEPGMYMVQLNIVDTLTNDVFFNEASYSVSVEDKVQAFITSPDTLEADEQIVFDSYKTNLPGFILENSYWDFGDGNKNIGDEVIHSFDKAGDYYVKLVTEGTYDYSTKQKVCVYKKINVKRKHKAQPSANEWLLDADTIVLYSSNNPFSNDNPSEESLYKVELLNSASPILLQNQLFDPLRSNYIITENMIGDSLYSYTVGNEKNLMDLYSVYSDVKNKGFTQAKVKDFSQSNKGRMLYQTTAITFETDKSDLMKESFSALDFVYSMLVENDSLIVEIAAHTDNQGSERYNLDLSEKRALSVYYYMIQKGIPESRLRPKGHGASTPVAENTTEAGRALNRRVEFIIVGEIE